MGNFIRRCLLNSESDIESVDILIVGLESTGKTELAYKICGEIRNEYLKTKGCRVFNTNSDGTNIRITEVGGAAEFLDIWKYYFLDMYGIIFVVDSSSVHNICQSYKIFKNLMAHDFLVGKPFLIIANKQDVPSSVDCVDICEYLDIEYLANKYRNPCMIEACGNWTGSINEYDGLEFGISWLVKTISANKQFLINRINFHRIMLEHSSKLFESHRPYTGTRRKSSRFSFRDTRPKTAPPTAMLSENGSYLTRRPSATISTKSGQSQATDLGISEPPNGSNSNTEGLSVVEEELPHNEQLERITMNKNHTETVVVVSNRTHEDLTVEDLSLTLQHVELNKTANGVA